MSDLPAPNPFMAFRLCPNDPPCNHSAADHSGDVCDIYGCNCGVGSVQEQVNTEEPK